MQETQVRSLGWDVPLEEKVATQSSILARIIPWIEESGRLQSMGSDMTEQLSSNRKDTCHTIIPKSGTL